MRRVPTLLLFAVLWAFPAAAWAADECLTDEDCPEGLVCMPAPCPAMACEDPADCPPCDATGFCMEPDNPGGGGWEDQCAEDQDCPFDFVCKAMEIPCPGVACTPCDCDCKPGTEGCDCQCPECPEPAPCEPVFVHVCVYEPKACSVHDDCGEGFECVAQEVCSGGCACAGCACPECPEGEECPPCDCPEPEPCTCDQEPSCEVTGRFCQPKKIPCAEDSQCPADWTCSPVGGTSCLCPDCACPAPDGEGGGTDCECGPCDCDQETAEQLCLPPGWANAGISDPDGLEYGQPRTDPTGGEEATGGNSPGGATNQDGTTPPAAQETGMVPPSKGGCTAATPADALPLAMLLLGLAARRRRS